VPNQPCVYILTNQCHGTLYVGVTSDLAQRLIQHRTQRFKGFTSKYGLTQLAYYEFHKNMHDAIKREKRIKKWNREWKIELIESVNPAWANLPVCDLC
jgi:putative endonuclease